MAESKEELKSLLIRVKEDNEKYGLKLNIQKMRIMTTDPITSWQVGGEKVETVTSFISRRDINNFRYADDTTLMAESEEELRSLLIKVKEENDKAG